MDPATEVVTVRPLTTNGVATLVASGLGVEPEPEFVQACWEATGGTPFLVRTLVEALREERIAPVASVGWECSPGCRYHDPGSLGDAAPRAVGSRRGPHGSGGRGFGAGRAGSGGPASRTRAPRCGAGG